jgi:hypothetical protein
MGNSLARGLLCVAFSLTLARAQTETPAPDATGSVSGHVYCADTNQPARLATVTLQPAPRKMESSGNHIEFGSESAPPATRTGLDGSFFFPDVKPGNYYLIADYPGYVSPLGAFAPHALRTNDSAVYEKVEKALPQVAVNAHKDSAKDIGIERGAAISGTVRFDDGSPANGIEVAVQRLDSDGEPSEILLQAKDLFGGPESIPTTDLGYYRISGLPPGKYIVKTTFPIGVSGVGGMFGSPTSGISRVDIGAELTIYSGNVFRETDAKPVEVTAGSERDGMDVTIPLLGLHAVGGSITALYDGHPVGEATVSLLFADGKSEIHSLYLGSSDEGRFNFRFVPEGEYILHIDGAYDTTQQLVRVGSGKMMPVIGVTHSYASVDLHISVHSDLSNVNISLPDKPADKSSATAQKQ